MYLIKPNEKQNHQNTGSLSVLKTLPCAVALLCGASLAPFSAAHAAGAGPFASCDASAYLTQGYLTRTYNLNLQTGDYKVAAKYHKNQVQPQYAWTDKASLDALGYNPNDGYVYGWSRFHKKPIRMHKDWSVEPLEVTNIPQEEFYAGDISIADNRYYLYSRISDASLYYIELDPSHVNYMEMIPVESSKGLVINSQDFAVHPYNGMIYAVEEGGDVIEVNPSTGGKVVLGNSEAYGSMGGAFFDGSGNLYVARNYDGKVFRVGIDSASYKAVLVADGPAWYFTRCRRCSPHDARR